MDNERDPRLDEIVSLGVVALLSAILLLLCIIGGGCTRKIYVPVENEKVRTEYRDNTTERTARDSVVIRDSVAVYVSGDTVRITQWRDRWRTRDRTVHDTVTKVVTDTVRETKVMPPEPARHELTKWQRLRVRAGDVIIIGAALGILILFIRRKATRRP